MELVKNGIEAVKVMIEGESQNEQSKPVNEVVLDSEKSFVEGIKRIGTGPLLSRDGVDSMWLVPIFYLFLIVHILVILICTPFACLFGAINNLAMQSELRAVNSCGGKRPWYSHWFWAWGGAITVRVLKREKGRLGLFNAYKRDFGDGGDNFWAMGGFWTHRYDQVLAIMKNYQERGPMFGNNKASRPSLWPPGESAPGGGGSFLLWTSGDKHTLYRRALHKVIVGKYALIKQRFALLPDYLKTSLATNPTDAAEFLEMIKKGKSVSGNKLGAELVGRSVWFIIFGVKLTDDEYKQVQKWTQAKAYFVMPQFMINLTFGLLSKKTTVMRREMVTILCRRPGVVQMFEEIQKTVNTSHHGGKDFSNATIEQTMDEVQFAVNFAGLLGTLQLLESTLFAINRKANTSFVKEDEISFPASLTKDGKSMTYAEAYNDSPVCFLKEVARVDPPVTSANCISTEPTTIKAKYCFGGPAVKIPAGTGNQYCVSLANRDEERFPNAKEFNPFRTNINDVISWNGQYPFPQECQGSDPLKYDPMGQPTYEPNGQVDDPIPLSGEQRSNFNRVCPGRNISLQIVTMILGLCPELNKTQLSVRGQ